LAGFFAVVIVLYSDIKGPMRMSNLIDLDNYLTAEQAADMLEAKVDTIRKHCHRGVIKVIKAGKSILIPKEEVERFRKEKRGRGRPAN
jgi:excisionase family DNA binding protein